MPMTARYPTTCGRCSGRIMPGEEIAKAGGRWMHSACAVSAGEDEGLLPGTATITTLGAPGSAGPTGVRTRVGPGTARVRKPDMVATEGALEVWTDGACSGNPGPGGWAWATK